MLCGGVASSDGLCHPCRADLPWIRQPCPVCGAAGHQPTADHGAAWRLARVVAPLRLAFPVRELVHRFKYRGQRHLGRCLGLLLADYLATQATGSDVLLAMPLHRSRLLERGYNQSFELARTLRAATGLPLWLTGVARARATAPQTQLSLSMRHRNVRNAFVVSRSVNGARVLLVDDVLTSGATANALAAALRAAGAREVAITTVARG